ncbi:Vinculin/alpha-catenin [Trinorchestia longiramus]|nr:Vinculin/alpha-catenin [Trinorchestia longiramus]
MCHVFISYVAAVVGGGVVLTGGVPNSGPLPSSHIIPPLMGVGSSPPHLGPADPAPVNPVDRVSPLIPSVGLLGAGRPHEYRGSLVRAARCLLSSVTRVLLLADTVVVKQLLLAKDKISHSMSRLESVTNFTEFVSAFSQFGGEMVELAHLTADRQHDLKDERRRAQMAAARKVLDRSTMLLLVASKVCLRHPECVTSRENRDTVFCQMRRAMDLIHYVVKDGVLETDSEQLKMNGHSPPVEPQGVFRTRQDDWDVTQTMYGAIRRLEDNVEMTRMTLFGAAVRDRLCQSAALLTASALPPPSNVQHLRGAAGAGAVLHRGALKGVVLLRPRHSDFKKTPHGEQGACCEGLFLKESDLLTLFPLFFLRLPPPLSVSPLSLLYLSLITHLSAFGTVS